MRSLTPVILLLLAAPPVLAHGVVSTVDRTDAVSVTFRYPDGSPLAFADYQVHGPQDPRPAVAGLTDRAGRVVFVPDRAGAWTVSVTTADGHGAQARVDVPEGDVASVAAGDDPGSRRILRTLLGLAVIALIAGILATVMRRSSGRRAGPSSGAGGR